MCHLCRLCRCMTPADSDRLQCPHHTISSPRCCGYGGRLEGSEGLVVKPMPSPADVCCPTDGTPKEMPQRRRNLDGRKACRKVPWPAPKSILAVWARTKSSTSVQMCLERSPLKDSRNIKEPLITLKANTSGSPVHRYQLLQL